MCLDRVEFSAFPFNTVSVTSQKKGEKKPFNSKLRLKWTSFDSSMERENRYDILELS